MVWKLAEELEASQFSTTTTLRGQAYVVVNANAFKGLAGGLKREANRTLGATNVLFDLELDLATSFSGKDLLLTKLRTGSFNANNSLSGVPTNQSALNIAYSSNDAGRPVLSVDKLFYQFPLGSNLSFTVGPNVAQDDMFGMYPSLYGDDAILNVSALAGAPLAYNQNQGAGAGIIWSGESWLQPDGQLRRHQRQQRQHPAGWHRHILSRRDGHRSGGLSERALGLGCRVLRTAERKLA